MESDKVHQQTAWNRWRRRIKGIVYLGIGSVFGYFALSLISAVGDMDDYYRVPYACECLECIHGLATAPDGRIHCAKYPPKDIKMRQVSAGYVVFCQAVVALCSLSGLVFAALTVFYGGQWLIGLSTQQAMALRRIRLRAVAPFAATVLPVFALLFLWPYGIVPM